MKPEPVYTLIESLGNFGVYRRVVKRSVRYVVAIQSVNTEGEEEILPLEGALFARLSAALERMDALFVASSGNPLYRVESI